METKHTPGPWRYCKQNSSPTTGQHMIAGSRPGYLAEARDCGSGDVEANARLIAAAPELLEALQALMPLAHDRQETDAGVARYEAARAAISKATGSAS